MGNEVSTAVKANWQGSCCCDQRGQSEFKRGRSDEWDGVQRYTVRDPQRFPRCSPKSSGVPDIIDVCCQAFTPIKPPPDALDRPPPRVIGLYDDIYKIHVRRAALSTRPWSTLPHCRSILSPLPVPEWILLISSTPS